MTAKYKELTALQASYEPIGSVEELNCLGEWCVVEAGQVLTYSRKYRSCGHTIYRNAQQMMVILNGCYKTPKDAYVECKKNKHEYELSYTLDGVYWTPSQGYLFTVPSELGEYRLIKKVSK